MPSLKIDWATSAAVKHACIKWHYSKTVPVGESVKVGAWEDDRFIGVVLFSHGANHSLGSPYGLTQYECIELTRIALSDHATPVSRIMAIAIRFLKSHCPKLRLIVSFADPEAGHHGGIYQATNWVYSGRSEPNWEYRLNGQRLNKRAYTGTVFGKDKVPVPVGAVRVDVQGKHRYLMPLDAEMRTKVAALAKPYPKRPKQATDATSVERQCNADPVAPLHLRGVNAR